MSYNLIFIKQLIDGLTPLIYPLNLFYLVRPVRLLVSYIIPRKSRYFHWYTAKIQFQLLQLAQTGNINFHSCLLFYILGDLSTLTHTMLYCCLCDIHHIWCDLCHSLLFILWVILLLS